MENEPSFEKNNLASLPPLSRVLFLFLVTKVKEHKCAYSLRTGSYVSLYIDLLRAAGLFFFLF